MDDHEPRRRPRVRLLAAETTERKASSDIGALFRLYGRWLLGRLRARYGRDVAEDLAQEAFLRASRYQQRGGEIVHAPALLLKIAHNAASEGAHRGGGRVAQAAVSWELAEMQDSMASSPEQEQALLLKQVILSLPRPLLEVFVMSRFGGLTYAEIGERLGLSVKTVEWRMSKALALCADAMSTGSGRGYIHGE